MVKQISYNRDKVEKIYLESNGIMKLIDIAVTLNLKDSQIRKWNSQDKWEDELKGMLLKVNSKVTKRVGASKSNKNVLGNCGEDPLKNKNVENHIFSKYLPEETLELIEAIKEKNPLDILWKFIFKKGDKKSPSFY